MILFWHGTMALDTTHTHLFTAPGPTRGHAPQIKEPRTCAHM